MSMALGEVFEPFVAQRPICVMARGLLEHLFNAERIDARFARTAQVQYTRAVLFSSVVDLNPSCDLLDIHELFRSHEGWHRKRPGEEEAHGRAYYSDVLPV